MRFKCEEVGQLTTSLENRPGVLANLYAYLSDRRVNLRAIAVVGSGDTGGGRPVAGDPEQAKQASSDAGVPYTSTECLALEMPNNPGGGLASIARTLSLAGINIDYMYARTYPKTCLSSRTVQDKCKKP